MRFCSACLLGINCRYNGKSKPNQRVLDLAKKEILIPVCPEQLGGLSTPREPAEQKNGSKQVFTKSGQNVSKNFECGANQVLKLMKLFNSTEAILKTKSPSCGCGKIYDGNFTGNLVSGDGVTTQILKQNGIKVITEEDI